MPEPIGSLNRIIIFAGDALHCATFFRDHFGFPAIGEWSSDWAEMKNPAAERRGINHRAAGI
jgi:hypothetical protein